MQRLQAVGWMLTQKVELMREWGRKLGPEVLVLRGPASKRRRSLLRSPRRHSLCSRLLRRPAAFCWKWLHLRAMRVKFFRLFRHAPVTQRARALYSQGISCVVTSIIAHPTVKPSNAARGLR